MKIYFIGVIMVLAMFPDIISASQTNLNPEAIYIKQLAHLFFMLSMVFLINRLRHRKLTEKAGWRHIRYSALFFILWSANAFCLNFLEKQAMWSKMAIFGEWQARVSSSPGSWAEKINCLARLDIFLCLPALLFLYYGLKKITDENQKVSEADS